MTERERQDTKMAVLYELRLFSRTKRNDTVEEIVELLDKITMAEEQEERI